MLYKCSYCKACFFAISKMEIHIMSVYGKWILANCKTEELQKTNLGHIIEKCDNCEDKFDDKRELEQQIFHRYMIQAPLVKLVIQTL